MDQSDPNWWQSKKVILHEIHQLEIRGSQILRKVRACDLPGVCTMDDLWYKLCILCVSGDIIFQVGENVVGLIPSRELEERRAAFVPPEADISHTIGS